MNGENPWCRDPNVPFLFDSVPSVPGPEVLVVTSGSPSQGDDQDHPSDSCRTTRPERTLGPRGVGPGYCPWGRIGVCRVSV